MAFSHASAGFSLAGLFTGLTLLTGLALVGVPLLQRRIEARARSAAGRVQSAVGGDFDRLESLARIYGRTLLAAPAAPRDPLPPLPASPVEGLPRWLPPLRRPLPHGIPEWRPWRRRAPPVIWRLR